VQGLRGRRFPCSRPLVSPELILTLRDIINIIVLWGHTCPASKTKAHRPSVRPPLVLIVFDVFEKQYLIFIVHLCVGTLYVMYRMTLISQYTRHTSARYRRRNVECCAIKESPCTLSVMTHRLSAENIVYHNILPPAAIVGRFSVFN